jgi:type VI secretion system protein VasJ
VNSAELLELGSKPIRPDSPTGDPGRESPEFEILQNEVRKLEHPDQPTPNWNAAVDAAATLLQQKSKDLLAAAYLSVGLFERDGAPGLLIGLTVVRDLVTQYWETLHPEIARLRARSSAIEWLGERGGQRVMRKLPGGGQAEAVKQCLERIEEIGAALEGKLDSGPALLADLRDALREAQDRSAPSASTVSAAPSGASSSAGSGGGPANVTSSGELDAALNEAKRLLRASAEYLRTNDPMHPLTYRAPRFVAWMGLKQAPPHTGGKTQIPPPQPPDLPQKLDQMLANGQWPGLLQEVEGRLAASVLWLDLHRYTATALEALGEMYQPAAEGVRLELAGLLKRLPELVDLRFANDMPLASAETKAWIASKVMAASGEAPPPASSAAEGEAGGENELAETRPKARALAREKKLGQALALLEHGASRAGSLREWVAWKLEVAALCQEQGHPEAALAQLEGVDERLKNSTLEDWDPRLCVEVLQSLLRCRQRLPAVGRAPDEAQKSREILNRLTRLDVVAALDMNGKK